MLDICRLCLGTTCVDKSIEDDKCDLLLKILCCLPVKPSLTDSLPNKICKLCEQKTESIYQYFNIIISADNKLQSILASGLEALTSFYKEILENCDLKEDTDIENKDIISVSIAEPSSELNISKSTQTDVKLFDDEILPENKVYIKEEIVYNNCISNNIDYVKHEVDLVPETEISHDEYDSDDKITLINLASNSDIKKETKSSKKRPRLKSENEQKNGRRKCDDTKLEVINTVKVKRRIEKPSIKSATGNRTKHVQENKINPGLKNQEFIKVKLKTYKRDDVKKWQCLTCFVNMSSRLALLQHYKDHVENPDAIKNASEPDSETDPSTILLSRNKRTAGERDDGWVHLDTGELKPYQCLKCDKKFSIKKYVRTHMLSHQVDKPYVCNLCGHTYKRAYDIVLHSRTHSGAKTFHCKYEDCDYSSRYSGAIKSHHQTHEPKFKFTCETCNKGFDVLTWFTEHKNLHTGAKPFVCDLCGRAFIYSRYLTGHRKFCHPETIGGPKILKKCEICGAEFPDRRRLMKHMQKHTGKPLYLCDVCGKNFCNGHQLNIHRMRHSGVKPFVCRTCGKDFVRKYSLKNHEAIHTGEKPHVCGQCGKAFVQRSLLVVHERYHSGARPFKCQRCNKGFVASNILCVHKKTCFKKIQDRAESLKSE